MVKHQLPKLRLGVRFPSPAPKQNDTETSVDSSMYGSALVFFCFVDGGKRYIFVENCDLQHETMTNATRNATQKKGGAGAGAGCGSVGGACGVVLDPSSMGNSLLCCGLGMKKASLSRC